ncbi:MAG: alpha-galactosidase [Firmicutes bacterium]|nr:alpha-galactosidase [Bacillota bacterium]
MKNPRIAFIGAGSYGFTFRLMVDILSFEALQDSEIVFMDIDRSRLDNLKIIIDEYLAKTGCSVRNIIYTLDLEKALEGCNFVINLVKIGLLGAVDSDMQIPKKYGLNQTIGDTSGIAGVFRGLRTMPFCEKMLKLIEKNSSQDVVVLNYTNPQAMLVMYAASVSKVPFIGLCHSVQGTTKTIAKYLDIPYDELDYDCAGINHMAWITKLERNGEDIYPLFRNLVKERGIYSSGKNDDDDVVAKLGPTRLDMLNRTGYMVTESSTHFAEYVPYYLRTRELADKYLVEIDKYSFFAKRKENNYKAILDKAVKHELPNYERSVEYGPQILNSLVTNIPCKVYANFINRGLITNLPEFSAVEVKSLVDRSGVHPCIYGDLPTQLAALNRMEINVHQLAVEAMLKHDRRYVYWALMMDPLTHSVLDIDQIENVVDELIKVHSEYLKGYLC